MSRVMSRRKKMSRDELVKREAKGAGRIHKDSSTQFKETRYAPAKSHSIPIALVRFAPRRLNAASHHHGVLGRAFRDGHGFVQRCR